jgi:NAD(P)-dependent dehydrogenase (short-subunit alcohol dehydrogenase family)
MSRQRSVVITGGAGGIGLATAQEFSQRGYSTGIWDRDSEAAASAADSLRNGGATATYSVVDVRDRSSIDDAMKRTLQDLGRVDVLVTAAGISHFVPFLDISEDEWALMLDIHLGGTFRCAQAVLPGMRAAGFGRIVCISSLAASSGSAGHVHYAAAKAGIVGFVQAIAKEVGPWGVTVNCVMPGAIDTPMLRDIPTEIWTRNADTPVGRIGKPADVASAVAFLASEEAEFITGASLNVSGGRFP